ncbi:Fibronectin type III domain protein [Emticicia oligotrophica DSM 17448]|uniref:Fibronectin type III domain protein n=1 Tax=Emticicia oligotrophica (strain DSM 17448 / CIP 109782 / MTCC 6937 / GPTSA100-15) TaxID=929562 RepID=A0ABM5N283_EMTOG|nr:Fibronectin type III domain protein [Emticicia oligotrophica DSM 17448]
MLILSTIKVFTLKNSLIVKSIIKRFVLFGLSLNLLACSIDKEAPILPRFDAVTISETTIASASLSVSFLEVGNQSITDYGIVYSETNLSPTLTDSKVSNGALTQTTSPYTYLVKISNLKANTVYYARAYVITESGTIYSNVISVKTLAIVSPSIKTTEASTYTIYSAKVGGSIETKGSYDISEYGICWSQRFAVPTIEHSKEKITGDVSTFPKAYSLIIYNLPEKGTIYYRAYVISNGNVIYGDVLTYTLEVEGYPKVSTDGAVYVADSVMKLNGTIVNKGKYEVTEYGMCWGFNDSFINPTVCENKGSLTVMPNSLPAPYSIEAKKLKTGVVYFYRSYLISNGITTFGTQKSFIIESK